MKAEEVNQIIDKLAEKFGAGVVELEPVLEEAMAQYVTKSWLWAGFTGTFAMTCLFFVAERKQII